MKFWLKQSLIAIDQLINAIFFFGYADETLSSKAWRYRNESNLWIFIDLIFFFDPKHCKTSFEDERLRLQSPPDER